ncbi:hypothetical protein LUZ60_017577 [Juncus effusus]|nr:hypothetical protein LUZ60_017577 [Juncus effusus]
MAFYLTSSLLVFLFLILSSIASIADNSEFILSTGNRMNAGTDSTIDLSTGDLTGSQLSVSDPISWGGLMGSNHSYFQKGGLDLFSAHAACGVAPLCHLNLTSNGAGSSNLGWYCEYVQVTSTGPHMSCTTYEFSVNRWLSANTWPYQLSAAIDACSETTFASAAY